MMFFPSRSLFLGGTCLLVGRGSAFVANPFTFSHVSRALCAKGRTTTPVLRALSMSASMQSIMESKLKSSLSPSHLEVINESHMHSGPAQESHFKVIVVSEKFEGKPLLARHRMITELFAEELKGAVHALSIQSKTPAQWEAEGHKVAPSPPCMGGSKADPLMHASIGAIGLSWGEKFWIPSFFLGHVKCFWKRIKQRKPCNSTALLATAWFGCMALLLCTPQLASAAGGIGVGGAGRGPTKVATKSIMIAVSTQAKKLPAGSATPPPTTATEALDLAFARFAAYVAHLLDTSGVGGGEEDALGCLNQARLLGKMAWATSSCVVIPTSGLIGLPLARAMVSTVCAHIAYSFLKFTIGSVALNITTLPHPQSTGSGGTGAGPGTKVGQGPSAVVKAASAGLGCSGKNVSSGLTTLKVGGRQRQAQRRPLKRFSASKHEHFLVVMKTGSDGCGTPMVARRLGTIPPLWLVIMTMAGGPAVGTLVAIVASRGHLDDEAARGALFRGVVACTLFAGGLSLGGKGAVFAARWAGLQAAIGMLCARILSPASLLFLYLIRAATTPRMESRTESRTESSKEG